LLLGIEAIDHSSSTGGILQYQVSLDVFEGPFDLLLDLISKQKIDVCDLSLTEIVRDYLDFISRREQVDLEVTSEFLLLAATLLKIKSNSLLGPDHLEELEDLSPAEARDLLVTRLLEYKKFKNAAQYLEHLVKSQYGFYRRSELLDMPAVSASELLGKTTISDLAAVLLSLHMNSGDEDVFVSTQHILSPPVNLSSKIDFVLDQVRGKEELTFRDLTRECSSKIEFAVTFLALLELYKRRKIGIEQNKAFGEIIIRLPECKEDSFAPVAEPRTTQDFDG
jgi:segregation and condensation protein A